MIKDTINKLCVKYEKTSWGDMLPDIFKTEEFEMAVGQLVSDVQAGQPFTPNLNSLFKSFDLCALEDVKVVFVNAHPYAEKGVSNGIAFSGKINPFSRELNNVTEEKFLDGPAPSLEYLPKEGVLMLNLAMTSPICKEELSRPAPDDHIPMWNPVSNAIIKQLSYRTVRTIFVFVGDKTEHLSYNVKGPNHKKIFIPSFKNDNDGWDSNDIFNRINLIRQKDGQEPIVW